MPLVLVEVNETVGGSFSLKWVGTIPLTDLPLTIDG